MFIIEQDVKKKKNFLLKENKIFNEFNNKNNNDFHIEYNANESIQKKKKLLEKVKNLSNIEYNEIFNILQENKCQYSGNNNGVFINLKNVNDEIIDKIFNFLKFNKKKKEELNDKDSVLENMKKDIQLNEIEQIDNNMNNTYKNNNNLSDDEDNNEKINIDTYLCFSSDEDNDLDNKLSLKKKKNKYTGKNAKLHRPTFK